MRGELLTSAEGRQKSQRLRKTSRSTWCTSTRLWKKCSLLQRYWPSGTQCLLLIGTSSLSPLLSLNTSTSSFPLTISLSHYLPLSLFLWLDPRNCTVYEKLVLKAILAEFTRSGLEEATLQQTFRHINALCAMDRLPPIKMAQVIVIFL